MMDRSTIKKMAEMTVQNGEVNEAVRRHVLGRFTAPDIKQYLFYLEKAVRQQQVRVRLPDAPDKELKQQLQSLFRGKELRFEPSPALGAGIQIEHGDDVVTITVRNMIERTVGKLKRNI
jgi:hypothetical protein